jgi:hypothetical protein
MLGKLCHLEKWCGLSRDLTGPVAVRERDFAAMERTPFEV